MPKSFEDFPVYKKGLNFTREANFLCNKIKGNQFAFIKDQLRRASASILLNIAEGSIKWNKKDKTNFYRIGQASAAECIAALDLFHVYQLAESKSIDKLKVQLREITNDLQALIFNVNKRTK